MSLVGVWTPAARAGHTGGEPPGNFGWLPLTGGSVEPPAEGIRKDTNGPDQASDADQHGAHLPGRLLVLANLDVVPALGLGHGPHLLSDSLFLPGKDTGCSGGGGCRRRPHQHATQTIRPPARRCPRSATGALGRGRWCGPSDPTGHGGQCRPWPDRPSAYSAPSEKEDGRAEPRPRNSGDLGVANR